MKTLRVMDRSGDTVLEFDETTATKEAEALFDRLRGSGHMIVGKTAAGAEKVVHNFSDLQQDNVAVPRIVGG